MTTVLCLDRKNLKDGASATIDIGVCESSTQQMQARHPIANLKGDMARNVTCRGS